MRKINENAVAIYSNFSMLFIWMIVILIVGQNLLFALEFNWKEWLAMIACAVFSVLTNIYNFKAT